MWFVFYYHRLKVPTIRALGNINETRGEFSSSSQSLFVFELFDRWKSFGKIISQVCLCLESVCLLHWCQSIMNEWKNAFNVKITIIEERLPKPLLCSTDTFHWREIWQENQHFASMTTVHENYFKSIIPLISAQKFKTHVGILISNCIFGQFWREYSNETIFYHCAHP